MEIFDARYRDGFSRASARREAVFFGVVEEGGAIASPRAFGHEGGMNTLQSMPGPLGIAVRYLGVVVLLAAYGGQV
ncbi:hypothetical protein C3Y92_10040 [Solidesulfovibrio carbinolicus]|uniref:Uncharacterized protein n=1 Tax=Solidesulfovibrio carbinolicus TaxID=296842 RepID=A0A4P6HK87_9BACT|nr:hypothetical protein C3Y92_10040 [Solidesulfovibrio carbinolicus]